MGNSPKVSALAAAFLFSVACPFPALGQVISPGRLSEAHAHLEGLRNCTQCHQLRSPGVDGDRCLSCHLPVAERIEMERGYHGSLSDVECGRCHKEHLGKSFRVTHFNAESFVHDSTGYTLRGRHSETECRACHRPDLVVSQDVRDFKEAGGALDRTYLGLGTDCATCHGGDDPHGGQFSDGDCASCHDEDAWKGAGGFDHSQARYALEGRHRELDCGLCHKVEGRGDGGELVRFRPVEASGCNACHQDPHRGRMTGACATCHTVEGWGRVRRERVEDFFDHGATRFALKGAHVEAPCQSCHTAGTAVPGVRLVFARGEVGSRTYPRPRFDSCSACHSDPHAGAFDGKGCETCHGGEVWSPAAFGLARHDGESRFALTGAHRATPCVACHQSGEGAPPRFRIEGAEDCRTCHRNDDPHESAFGDARCEVCHETGAFLMEDFDHDRDAVRSWIQACTVCHGQNQPHGEQFPSRECRECHSTSGFGIPDFDHSQSRFPLDGAHQKVSCDQCHRPEGDPGDPGGDSVRYRPLDLTCAACHGAGE